MNRSRTKKDRQAGKTFRYLPQWDILPGLYKTPICNKKIKIGMLLHVGMWQEGIVSKAFKKRHFPIAIKI